MIDKKTIETYIEMYIPSAKVELRAVGRTRETISAYRADDKIKFILKIDKSTFEIELGEHNSCSQIKNRVF